MGLEEGIGPEEAVYLMKTAPFAKLRGRMRGFRHHVQSGMASRRLDVHICSHFFFECMKLMTLAGAAVFCLLWR